MKVHISPHAMEGASPGADVRLIEEISDRIDDLVGAWGVPPAALPSAFRAVAHLDHYLGNVTNGGHAQFVGNAGARAGDMLDDLAELMTRAGLAGHAELARKACDWVRANPSLAARQTGFKGGIAPALHALDTPFFDLTGQEPPEGPIAALLRARNELEAVADDAERTRRNRAAVMAWVESAPEVRAHIARHVTGRMRDFFADGVSVALALAAGDGNTPRFARQGLTPPPIVEDGLSEGVMLFSHVGGVSERKGVCTYTYGPEGLTVTPLEGEAFTAPITVPMDKILRVQRLAGEFKIPQSVGLRWWRMGAPFALRDVNLHELDNWQPGKYWLRLMLPRWAVKGSPEKSTFIRFPDGHAGMMPDFTESLSQDDLARLSAEAGLERENENFPPAHI